MKINNDRPPTIVDIQESYEVNLLPNLSIITRFSITMSIDSFKSKNFPSKCLIVS